MTDYTLNGESRGLCRRSCGRQDKQLNTYDYLADIPGNAESEEMVEVQFKNTRKGFYLNANRLPLVKGDIVAVEASPGHDIGVVTLTGKLVALQMKKAQLRTETDIKRIYRKAKPVDMDKFHEAKALENSTMIRSRQIAKDLGLEMKIGDVEYQGDGNKAIFYYIANERVDFRKLIKVLAEEFHVRIEMKQIGARQEAGRIGGIGPCGRELCCATWTKNFRSVSTTATRCQGLSPNPQKLAGQCAKLKCCLNYETDTYIEASRKLPRRDTPLEAQDGTYYLFKTDVLAGLVTYSSDKSVPANLVTMPAARALEIIRMNRNGEKPEALVTDDSEKEERHSDILSQDSLTRFDKNRRKKSRRRPKDEETPSPKAANEPVAAENPATAQRRGDGGERRERPRPNDRGRNPRRQPRKGRKERNPQERTHTE